MFQRHLSKILTYTQRRLTDGAAEGVNNKMQQVREMACGFGNIEHSKIAVYFHCGGLELYPH